MSESTLQGRMNAMKEGVLNLLKTEGTYMEYCPKQGFIYRYTGSIADVVGKDLADIFGYIVKLSIALKDGNLYILNLEKLA